MCEYFKCKSFRHFKKKHINLELTETKLLLTPQNPKKCIKDIKFTKHQMLLFQAVFLRLRLMLLAHLQSGS